MSRTVDLSVPRWARVAVVFVLLGGGFVAGAASLLALVLDGLGIAANPFLPSLGVSVAAYVSICAAWAWRVRDRRGDSVWGAIPEGQYTGRHAESGGIARKEQEDAIRELQDREE